MQKALAALSLPDLHSTHWNSRTASKESATRCWENWRSALLEKSHAAGGHSHVSYWISGPGADRFGALPGLALAVLSVPVATSRIEGIFSVVNKRLEPQRNCLSSDNMELEMFGAINKAAWLENGIIAAEQGK